MKKIVIFKTICLLMLLPLSSCSEDDSPRIQEEFLSARVNGENFNVDKENGVLSAKKQLSSYGTINLLVRCETHEGKNIEFLVLYYYGEDNYAIGNRSSLTSGDFMNSNWCKYSEASTGQFWSTANDSFFTGSLLNYVEITEDDGSYIAGNFSFEGHDSSGSSFREISEGNFRLKITP
ncbi:hypothetical protein [Autumnicola psychrophila]|uniref:Uncharacterized protein n=1 Tax=Autumnicola psychrophila TaxID=3075592 RepID=A0ABU3DR00_9FLAO|nr:hypothetical protein [Zunongwangia sp. F225]MDT0685934.1 hypothetical protein [Zunongwangia sp. F225]